jgi:hypothetical protein
MALLSLLFIGLVAYAEIAEQDERWQLVLRTADRKRLACEALTALVYQAVELLELFDEDAKWLKAIAGQAERKAELIQFHKSDLRAKVAMKKADFWATRQATIDLLTELKQDDLPIELPDSVQGCRRTLTVDMVLEAHQWELPREPAPESESMPAAEQQPA